MDVQTALQQFEHGRRTESIAPVNNEHIFLILDRKVQEIPWESIPILRGRAVSRVPSLAFLSDRLPPTIGQNASRLELDSQKVYYILNPSGDLAKTQKTFEPWLKAMSEKCGWRGIIGREPSSLEITSALQTYDLIL
jgi:separase